MAKPVARSRVKGYVDKDVYTLARERARILFDRFDTVSVFFSGGKDSTVALNVVLDAAIELGLCHRVEVVHWDEEAVDPDTVAYVGRVRARVESLGGRFRWCCVPIRARNACSRNEPFWYPWAPESRAKWCRELPERAETELPGFQRVAHVDATPYVYAGRTESIASVNGMRTQESLRRYVIISMRDTDSWIWYDPLVHNCARTMPVYDWTAEDIWTAIGKFGWDYSRAYDKMTAIGVPLMVQRISPPFAEEPLTRLWQIAQCWPELWERLIYRVEGAATAARYSNSPLYGMGKRLEKPPEGMTWQELIKLELSKWPPTERAIIAARIQSEIRAHNKRLRSKPIPDTALASEGLSWAFLYMIARRGDLKGRRKVQHPDWVDDTTGRGIQTPKLG